MIDENRRQLFTHPATLLLTHVVFPLLNLFGVAYIFWITKEALDPTLHAKGVAALCAAGAIPLLGALASAIAFKRRPGLWQMFAFSMAAAAFLYFFYPVSLSMSSKVDNWIISGTPFLAMFSGLMPMIFAGVAAVALEKLSESKGVDIGVSGGLLLLGPICFFMSVEFATTIDRALRGASPVLKSVLGHVFAVGMIALTFLFFVGLLRGLFQLTKLMGRHAGRTAAVMVCAVVLPFCGLTLNLAIPFPADFANPWPWALSAYTALVLLPRPRSDRVGLLLYFLQSAAGPFVLYFFLLFVPFLPLAIPAIILVGTGFLILAPTILFRFYTREMYEYWQKLRETYSVPKILAVAVAGFLVLPALFCIDVEIERRDFKTLLAWHTEEDYDEPAKPMPCSQSRAEKIMDNVNDFALGAEIPFLSGWRSFRVYDGMYLADNLRNELNLRVLGKKSEEELDWRRNARNLFGAGMFGTNPGRRSARFGSLWTTRALRTTDFNATAETSGDALYTVKVAASADSENSELVLKFKLPAGAWIEGMRLKLADGTWKQARASERKAAEWVYRKITEQRRDPSIVTLDNPTEGTFKIFPVGKAGREAELTIRLPAKSASSHLVRFAAVPPPPKTKRKMGKDGKWKYETEPKKELVWKDVANPDYSASPEIYRAAGAEVSVVGADWMEAHLDALKKLKTSDAEDGIAVRLREFDGNDRELWSKLRREVRAAAREFADKGEFSDFGFKNDTIDAAYEKVDDAKMAILRREFPGQMGFKDLVPVEGWFFLPKAGGGRVAVPYRKGEGAVVFASLEGAVEIGGKWADGAKAWELENMAFMKPALDVRAELLKATRESGALTTKSAYIAVETTAQEKGLKQKEMESLYGNQNLEFEEPESVESSDAPGMLLLLAFVAVFFAIRHRIAGARAKKENRLSAAS